MIIPYRVDVPYDRKPFLNWLMIAALVAVFAAQVAESYRVAELQQKKLIEQLELEFQKHQEQNGENDPEQSSYPQSDQETPDEHWQETDPDRMDELTEEQLKESMTKAALESMGAMGPFVLIGWAPKGLLGHMWLHGGILHLLGNLLFLWVFGNAVCAKVGNLVYLPLYIVCGLIAAAAHLILRGGPMLGASGAIFGVVGMYLVFFPENDVDCVWIFTIPLMLRAFARSFTISGYWIILMWLLFNVWGAMQSGGRTAYFAHLGGFAAGCTAAVVMLKAKWVGVERYEKSLLQLIGLEKTESPDLARSDLSMWPQQHLTCETPTEKPQTMPAEPVISESEAREIWLKPQQQEELIRFACACGKRIKVPSRYAGRKGNCPRCSAAVAIPEETQPARQAPGQNHGSAHQFIRFACTCGKRIKAPPKFAGKSTRCPNCSERLKIPDEPPE